jgi:hypothetical protein
MQPGNTSKDGWRLIKSLRAFDKNKLSMALPEQEKSLVARFCLRNRAALAGLVKN